MKAGILHDDRDIRFGEAADPRLEAGQVLVKSAYAGIIASRVTSGEFSRATRLLQKGLLHPELIVTHQLALRDVTRAFEQVDRDEPSTIKIVLSVQES